MSLILGIESSCDETAAAVVRDGYQVLSSCVASQIAKHAVHGGVVPELAAREHLVALNPVVEGALREAGVTMKEIGAIAVTQGPGLIPALLVGLSFAKGLAMGNGKPLIGVNHFIAHIYGAFLDEAHGVLENPATYPLLALVVSGGHTSLMLIERDGKARQLGCTIDDAAGEALDKGAKLLGLGYPGGPVIDRLAREGDPEAFRFAHPHVDGFDFSFSGLKTSFLYTLRDAVADDPDFIDRHKADLCASLQHTIVEILLKQLVRAAKEYDIRDIAVAGGVSANSGLRNGVVEEGRRRGWRTFVPEFRFTTDNAAMIAVAGYYHYLHGDFSSLDVSPVARIEELM